MKKNKIVTLDDVLTINNVREAYSSVMKTCKNKKGKYKFNLYRNINIENIYRVLKNGSYRPLSYILFIIYEPKPRLVMSQCVTDKIVNHFIAKFILIPNLESKLSDNNIATRVGKGSSYGNKLMIKYINTLRQKGDVYCLKLDISKYFYNINHEILINKLISDGIDLKTIEIIKKLINETNNDYVNNYINKIRNEKKLDDYKWICAFENVIVNDFWRGKNSLLNAFLDTSLKFDERKLSLYREIVFLDNLVDEGLFEYVLDLIDSINDHSLLEYVIYLISNQKLYNEDKELYFDYIKKLKDYVIYGSVGYLKKIYCYLNDSPYLHETLLVIRGNYEISKLKFLCDILDANSLFSSMYQYNTFLEVLPIVMELNESEQYDILCSLKYILNNKNILQFNIEFNKLIKNIKNNKSIHINNKNNDNKSKILEVLDEFNNDEEVTCDSFIRKRRK